VQVRIIQGLVAQWLERGTHNPLVAGSIPAGPTTKEIMYWLRCLPVWGGWSHSVTLGGTSTVTRNCRALGSLT
jgi:hypothetical protein